VEARKELDLRLGAIFTRYQTLRLARQYKDLEGQTLSYGPCQFPTLGFVVDRFWKIKCHVPETFYYIDCFVEKLEQQAKLKWSRGRLFDKLSCVVIYEMCVDEPEAVVTALNSKPTKKW
jgi:DNA topoisomerase-3